MEAIAAAFNEADVPLHLSCFVLGSARIFALLSFAPFFGPQLNAAVRLPLLIALYIPLHPLLMQQNAAAAFSLESLSQVLMLGALLGKEVVIGMILGYVTGCVFYAVMCAGIIIDNQRGASQAQTQDPFGGEESSPFGLVLLLAMVTLFFSSGAFMNFLSLFYGTYSVWPPASMLPALLHSNLSMLTIGALSFLMLQAVLMCAPFVLVALMCDVALGLINRFSPQLNVFILSMPIKSGACALLILVYLGPFFNHAEALFGMMGEYLQTLQLALGPGVF